MFRNDPERRTGRLTMSRVEAADLADEAKRVQIPIRTTRAFRDRLKASADANDRSLTQEIEARLEQSLREEERAGGREKLAIEAAIMVAVTAAESASGKSWLTDFATWHAMSRVMNEVLKNLRPPPPNDQQVAKAMRDMRVADAELKELNLMLAQPGSNQQEIVEAIRLKAIEYGELNNRVERLFAAAREQIEQGRSWGEQFIEFANSGED